DLVHRAYDLIQRDAGIEHEHAAVALFDTDLRAGGNDRLAAAERLRLADLVVLADGHGQAAMGDGGRLHAHVLADDDGAGAGVDHHLGRGVALFHFQVLHHGHVIDPLVRIQRGPHADGATVERLSHARAEGVVDLVDDPLGGGEVRAVQVEHQVIAAGKRAGDRAFHRGAAGNTANTGHV